MLNRVYSNKNNNCNNYLIPKWRNLKCFIQSTKKAKNRWKSWIQKSKALKRCIALPWRRTKSYRKNISRLWHPSNLDRNIPNKSYMLFSMETSFFKDHLKNNSWLTLFKKEQVRLFEGQRCYGNMTVWTRQTFINTSTTMKISWCSLNSKKATLLVGTLRASFTPRWFPTKMGSFFP